MLIPNSIRAVVAAMAILFSTVFSNNALGAFANGDAITLTQDVWGVQNPISNNYGSVYASTLGLVEVGIPGAAGFSIQFSSVNDYLPASGAPGPLSFDLSNPTGTSSGAFGGEVLALRLNIDFSDAGVTLGALGIPFGDLQLRNFDLQSNLNGLTVRQFLGKANNLLGGGSSFFNSIPELYAVTRELNGSFFGGVVYPFAQDHLRVVYLPGDFQEDGDVDCTDLTQWKASFGMSVGATHLTGDADFDADVDGADFLTWQRQFGGPALVVSAHAPVPEPATSLLFIVAAAGIRRMGGRMRQQLINV